MKEMSEEKAKEVEQTQEILFETFLEYVQVYCSELKKHEFNKKNESLGQHVHNLSLAILALNGIDTYECNM